MSTTTLAAADIDLAELLGDHRIRAAYDYWIAKRGARPLPSRRDLDPVDIPKLLPHVMLVAVEPDGRYRYRLIGTANVAEHGLDATGRYLDAVLPGPEYRTHVLGLYDACFASRRPLYSESLFYAAAGFRPLRHLRVLFMPLSATGGAVDQVFVVQIFSFVADEVRESHFLDAPPHREIVHQPL